MSVVGRVANSGDGICRLAAMLCRPPPCSEPLPRAAPTAGGQTAGARRGEVQWIGATHVVLDGRVHHLLVGCSSPLAVSTVLPPRLVADGRPLEFDVETGQGAALGRGAVAAGNFAVPDHDVVGGNLARFAQEPGRRMGVDFAETPRGVGRQVAFLPATCTPYLAQASHHASEPNSPTGSSAANIYFGYFGHGRFSLSIAAWAAPQ